MLANSHMQLIRDYLKEAKILDLVSRFYFLNPNDETIVDKSIESKVLDGTLNIGSGNGTQRTLSFTVDNTGFDFLLNPKTFWVRQKFKLELGYKIDGTEYYFKQGTFVLDNIDFNDQRSDNSVSMTCADKFALLNGDLGGYVSESFTIEVGTPIKQVFREVLTLGKDTLSPILNIGNDVTPYTLTVASGSTYADMLTKLNGMLAYNMYYDVDGILRCEPEVPDIYKECLWDFHTNEHHYQGGSCSYSLKDVYNAVKVEGNNVNGDLATGYAENRNPQSYFNVYRTGGAIVAPKIEDTVIPNDTYAQGRAEYELKKLMAHFSSVSFAAIPLFWLTSNKIITLTSENLNLERERFLLNSVSMPLKKVGGVCNVNAVKASDLSFI